LQGDAESNENVEMQEQENIDECRDADIELDENDGDDVDTVFAETNADGDNDVDNKPHNDSNIGSNEANSEINLGKNYDGSVDSSNDSKDRVLAVMVAIEKANLNLDIDLQLVEDTDDIITATASDGDLSISRGEVIALASDDGGSRSNGLGTGKEAERGESKEGSKAEGDHFS